MWELTKWYEKVAYVIGWMVSVYFGLCFVIGLIIGILES